MSKLLAPLLLSILVLIAFWGALNNGFVHDDEPYVTQNPNVRSGLTASSIAWAWTSEHAANWHPLTWMSHMLDFELFGENPRGHHATSVILHLVNTLLVFFWLERMTSSTWRSFCVAALFGIHPLRVESVAWVAERKDVLSTLFWLLASIAYVRYARAGKSSLPWLATVLLAIGLTAKPMLLTLPFALLLLDAWPLGRWRLGMSRLLREKVPMFVLIAASAVVTLWAQRSGGALIRLEDLPFSQRAQNAVVSLLRYVGKAIWPLDLAVFYPHPQGAVPMFTVLAALLTLLAITAVAIRAWSRRPHLALGWLWFVGTLIPVLGLVQVGSQALADRYTYVPLVGLILLAVWSIPENAFTTRAGRIAGGLAFGVLLLCLTDRTRAQVRTWHDPVTLFTHALVAGGESAFSHTSLADALDEAGRTDDAIAHYRAAIRLDRRYAQAHNNLGVLLYRLGRWDDAIAEYTAAIEGGEVETRGNLARALAAAGRMDEATRWFEEAIRLEPRDIETRCDFADALYRAGRVDGAVLGYEEVLRIRPELPEVWNNLAVAQTALGRLDESLASFDRALALRPDYPTAHANRAAALYAKGDYAEAWSEVEHARRGGVEPPARLIELLVEKRPSR